MRLSVLLVNYNGMRYLADCLKSISRFAPPETEVILVDNGSTDGSVDFILRHYPWVRVIQSQQNLGFSAGNNLAGKDARGQFILLLNVDAELLEPILPVIDWFEANTECGALTINMVDGKRIARACTGRFPSPARLALLRKMLVQPNEYSETRAHLVDWVQGSFLLTRADNWRNLRGLDESHFMYAEDVDFCKRVFDSGLRCAYLPQVKYLHWGGYNPSRVLERTDGLCLYISHHMKGLRWLVCWIIIWGGCLARAILYGIRAPFDRDGQSRMKSRASWRAFWHISRGPAARDEQGRGRAMSII